MIIFFYFFPVRSMRSGEARQTEEYVPTIPPNMSASVNPRRLSGPKINIAIRTIMTVSEVKIERFIVSYIDWSITFESTIFLLSLHSRFERIRSITTIVSLIEYPRIVSIAVKKNVSILNSGKKNEVST